MDKNPSFVATVELKVNPNLVSIIEKELEICRVIYNCVLGELLKRQDQMKRLKKYKKIRRQLAAVSQHLERAENRQEKEVVRHYEKEKDLLMDSLFELQLLYGINEYAMHEYIKPIRKHFGGSSEFRYRSKNRHPRMECLQKETQRSSEKGTLCAERRHDEFRRKIQ